MKRNIKVNFGLVIALSLIFFIFAWVTVVNAQSNADETVRATVKIGICGDDFAEGDEDCDGSDLQDLSCIQFGYDDGELHCDKACEFDFTECDVGRFLPFGDTDSYQVILRFFDLDGSGRIERYEAFDVIKLWDSVWTEKKDTTMCDIDLNGMCNLIDLSILLYFVDR